MNNKCTHKFIVLSNDGYRNQLCKDCGEYFVKDGTVLNPDMARPVLSQYCGGLKNKNVDNKWYTI